MLEFITEKYRTNSATLGLRLQRKSRGTATDAKYFVAHIIFLKYI